MKRFPALHLNVFVPKAFNKRNLSLVQDKNILCLAFDHAKESVSSKNAVRLLNKTVAKFSETWNENLVQKKLIITKIKKHHSKCPWKI